MATVKKTLSLDADAWDFTVTAAAQAGMSPSAWLSRAARQQAIRQGYRGPARSAGEQEEIALADEIEAAEVAEGGQDGQEWRAAG